MSEENKEQVAVASEEETSPKLPTGETGVETNDIGDVNPDAVKEVTLDNPLKQWFVEYVGEKYSPEDGVVTVALAIRAFAEEFPEFLMVLAEENWIRGYRQGIADSETGVRAALEAAGIDPAEQKIIIPSEVQEEEPPAEDE